MTRYKIHGKKLIFRWGTHPTDLFGSVDVNQAYCDLGGSISPRTEVTFSSTFPVSTYKKTALTNNMPNNYRSAGSLTAEIYEQGKPADYMSLSDYFDLKMHDPVLGDHHNLYLQHKIGKEKPDHTKKYLKEEDRHIKLEKKLYVAAYIDDVKVYEDYIRANLQKPKVQAFVKRKSKMRKGKGFSRDELTEVGLSLKGTLKLGIPIDTRRKTKHKENMEILRGLI